MKVIFDLDYTLLDTKKFKADLADVLGMTAEEFNKSYKENFSDPKENYSIEKHLKILGQENNELLKKRISNFLKGLDKFLYPESEKIIDLFSKENELFMISYGDKGWQKMKLDNLSIKKYFPDKNIIYADAQKEKFLEGLKEAREKKIIVNDNAREGLAMKKVLGGELYLIDGPYTHNTEHKEKIYTLEELEEKFFSSEQKRELKRQIGVR